MTKQQRNTERILFILILFIGFLVRLYKLGENSFWLDEGLTAFVALMSPKGIITYTATTSFEHPPIYFLIAHFWQAFVGVDNEWTWRFLSVFWGMLTLPIAYLFFKKLADWRIALLGILLLAFNPFFIGYARETRMYAFLGMLGVLSTYLLIRSLSNDSRWFRAGYILTIFVGAFTHYMFVLLIIAHFLYLAYLFLRNRKNANIRNSFWTFTAAYVIAAGFLLIWIKSGSGTTSTLTNLENRDWSLQQLWHFWIRGKIRYFLFTFAVTEPRFRLTTMEIRFIYAYWTIIAGGLLVFFWQNRKKTLDHVPGSIFLILALILTPFVIVFFIPRGTPPRFFIDIATIFILLLAWMIGFLALRNITRPFIILLFIPIIATIFIGFREIYATPTTDFREATEFIKQNVKEDDLVVFTHPWGVGLVRYYLHDAPVQIDVFPKNTQQPTEEATAAYFKKLFQDNPRLWLGPVDPGTVDKKGVIDHWLAINAFQIAKRWFPNSTYVSLYLAIAETTTFTCQDYSDQNFGGVISLNQACTDTLTSPPGAGLRLKLDWTVQTKPQDDLVAVVELLDQNGQMWFKRVSPLQGGYLPSSAWQKGMTIQDNHGIWIPSNTPSGRYSIELGIYDTTTGQHLSLGDKDFLSLFTIEVQ